MKNLLITSTILLLFWIKIYSQCGGGELYFRTEVVPSTFKFDLTITTSEYCWLWNSTDLKPIPVSNFSDSESRVDCAAYAAPKKSSASQKIPWGIFSIRMSVYNQDNQLQLIRNFKLDLRDQNWSSYNDPNYPGIDTFVEYDSDSNLVRISARQFGINNRFVVGENELFQIWTLWGISTPEQSNFKVPVTLKNRVEGQTFSFGNLKVGTTYINSDNSFEFKNAIQNTVEHGTTETIYNNQRKYSFHWSNTFAEPYNSNQNLYNSIYNFSIDNLTTAKSVTRNFRTVWTLTLKNNLSEHTNITADEVYFKDPTTDNQFHLYSASGSGYVKTETFDNLNELINGSYQKYSVKAKSSITYDNRTYYWDGGDFNPSAGTDILVTANTTKAANYKGHLISNNSSGFTTNSQRKIVRTSDGKYHLIYESLGYVWYTTSSNNCSTWDEEKKISHLGMNSKSASITAYGNDVYIVYQSDETGSPNIRLDKYQNGILSWSGVVHYLSTYSYDTKPVVAAFENLVCVVYKPTSTSSLYAVKFLGDGTKGTNYVISNTDANSQNPSIVASNQRFDLAYQNGSSQIRYLELSVDLNTTTVYEYQIISSGSPYPYNFEPSISAFGSGPIISWSGQNTSVPNAVVKRRVGSTWSGFNSFGNNTVRSTNNNSISDGTESSIIAWCNMYNEHKFVKLANGTFSSILSLPESGGNGQIQISNGTGFADVKAVVYKSPSSGIYPVKYVSYNFQTLQKMDTDPNMNYGRTTIVQKDKKNFVYYLGGVKVDGENIRFKDFVDTMKIENSEMMDEIMTTEYFHLTPKSELEFSNLYYAFDNEEYEQWKENNAQFKIELVNLNGKTTKGEFNISKFEESTITDDELFYKIDCSNLEEGTYYLRVNCKVDGDATYYVNNVMYEDLPELSKKSYEEIKINGNETPNDYQLGNNYPNPFNPTTTITFSIPNSQFVILKVYDVLGKEVAVLVEGVQNSGRHEVKFDASELASGIYFYTLKASKFTQTNKMILVK